MSAPTPFSDELAGLEMYPGIDPAMLPPNLRRALPRTTQVVNGNGAVTQNVTQGASPAAPTQGETLQQTLARLRARAEQAQRELSDLRAKDVDVSALEQYGKTRAEGGQNAMLNALAAQFAGDRFSGVQDSMLRRSLAAQQELKLGQGMVTPDGRFVRDPYALRDAAEKRAMEDAQFYDKQATTLGTQIQSIEDRRTARLDAAEQRQLDRDARRENAQIVAGSANASRQATADARLAALEDKLADDYRTEIKDSRKIVTSYENLKTTPATAAGDISFIFQYMKMLDPASVVREGEFATAQNAGSVPDQIYNLYNRALQGTRLNPQQRQQFLGTAANLANNAQRSITAAQQHYGNIAKRRGLDERNIFDRGGVGATVKVDY